MSFNSKQLQTKWESTILSLVVYLQSKHAFNIHLKVAMAFMFTQMKEIDFCLSMLLALLCSVSRKTIVTILLAEIERGTQGGINILKEHNLIKKSHFSSKYLRGT